MGNLTSRMFSSREYFLRTAAVAISSYYLLTRRNYFLVKMYGLCLVTGALLEENKDEITGSWSLWGLVCIVSIAAHNSLTERVEDLEHKLVVITGCDSGLGYSFAVDCKRRGLHVIAGCLSGFSEGAVKLVEQGVTVWEVDITDSASVKNFVSYVVMVLSSDAGLKLQAVVNNAGVMVFGEFEWLTEEQINQQIQVNLLGTCRVAREFLVFLRMNQGRLINVTSHCAEANLPGLSIYGATKSAIRSWSEGLRVEQAKYGVKVITFVPGSFVLNSNIAARQAEYGKQQEESMCQENREFFGDYFVRYHSYLSVLSKPKPITCIQDDELHEKFASALLEVNPLHSYKHEPFRYKIYHFLFRISPIPLRDYFVEKFIQMPKYSPSSRPVFCG